MAVHTESSWALGCPKVLSLRRLVRTGRVYKQKSWTRNHQTPGAHCAPHGKKEPQSHRAPCLVGHRVPGALGTAWKVQYWGRGEKRGQRKASQWGEGKANLGLRALDSDVSLWTQGRCFPLEAPRPHPNLRGSETARARREDRAGRGARRDL